MDDDVPQFRYRLSARPGTPPAFAR